MKQKHSILNDLNIWSNCSKRLNPTDVCGVTFVIEHIKSGSILEASKTDQVLDRESTDTGRERR